MTQPTFASSRLLLPARPWFVYLSLIAAYLINLLPFSAIVYLPDFLALTLCFWGIREPRKVGMGIAFVGGLMMDVAYGSLMGQHMLAYVLLAYFAASISKRVLWFPLIEQALHVLPILLGAQLIQLVVRMIAGDNFPGLGIFVSPLLGTLLWVPATYLLLLPQFQAVDRDENRPI